ncbi:MULTISPECIES: sulfatase-like hydrolase/transferase [Rhodopseudomonas]|uniref:Sulfatase N-terminal domain-containing protein n=1 Tax=Rhodopseudomonas palustris TaxID=1076 RepID=A0A0D7ECH4_RHOPL|nr:MULTISPECIES: sulfatase-like hydrolase/transferase [Rhodopseudomonas]KIZ38195.1 hypothetical protein OO17_23005 [Rhodopseudomonas palustris]MDF3812858.1 sulfatase-like hydrolase/transferase [Rhodopseudomonas sp. BAL398]WOK15744.1 sulfatase-like hydrolase/transferase [Rhodopseudomonas sp. BAL398]
MTQSSIATVPMPRVGSPTISLLLAGLLLPNLSSIATTLSLIDLGLPPRTAAILLYGVVALIARRSAPALTCVLFLAVLAFDLIWTIALMFGLAPSELLTALEFAQRINILSSPLYVALLASVVLTSVLSLRLLMQRETMARGNPYVFFGAMLALAAADAAVNTSSYFDYNALFGGGRTMQSAVTESGFGAVAGRNHRNVVVVMVESLGYLVDQDGREAIAAPLRAPRIAARYDVTSGRTGYYGSTTAGEMRELCGTRLPYTDVAANATLSCLPAELRARGYSTLAFHGFSSGMFGRKQWYPKIGFSESYFAKDLLPASARLCGGTFRGACDADLTPRIVKRAARRAGPRLIYWLTLNTHFPVAPGDARTDLGCGGEDSPFATPAVCQMAELWHDLFTAVADLALDPAVAPAEILIVGDHAPPLWSKRSRDEFAPGQVAWYRLTPRATAN